MTEDKKENLFYKAIWRWHFYAGVFVTPFIMILAVTGMIMMYISYFDGRDGENVTILVPKDAVSISYERQSNTAQNLYPDSKLVEFMKAPEENRVNIFRLKLKDNSQTLVAINPYTGDVVDDWKRREGWYDFADEIHSDLLLGTKGDRLLEIAAGFGIVLLITGLYLWWPRDKKMRESLLPNFTLKGRDFFKELHVSIGVYISIFFFLFLLSGMTWTGVWGGKIVQAWSTFPAEKWSQIPLSDKTHASLNNGSTEGMPWAITQTKLPISGTNMGISGTLKGETVNLDSIVNLAHRIGFESRYRISFPKEETSVWTINQDTMNGDALNPFSDKTVHIDRYTGKVLAIVTFDDYSLAGKTMAVSIPLHMGLVSIWNLILNTIVCLAIIVMCITGIIMWWKRRPSNTGFRLLPPAMPKNLPHFQNAMLVMLIISLLFPLVGLTLVSVLFLDFVLFSRINKLKKILK